MVDPIQNSRRGSYPGGCFNAISITTMQARLPPLELPRSGSQGSAVVLTALSARLLRAPLRALTILLLSERF